MPIWPVSWLVEEKYCGGAIFVGTAWSYGLSAVPMEIAAGSKRGERGIRGLHHERVWNADVTSLLAGGKEVLWGQHSLLAQYESYEPMETDGWRIASWEAVECGCSQSYESEILWGSNLCWYNTNFIGSVMYQLRLLPGSQKDRMGNKQTGPMNWFHAWLNRGVLWVSNICWHSVSDMASAMMGSCWKHQDSRGGKHSFHILDQFSFWWWLILFGFINLGGRGFLDAQRRSCFLRVITIICDIIVMTIIVESSAVDDGIQYHPSHIHSVSVTRFKTASLSTVEMSFVMKTHRFMSATTTYRDEAINLNKRVCTLTHWSCIQMVTSQ